MNIKQIFILFFFFLFTFASDTKKTDDMLIKIKNKPDLSEVIRKKDIKSFKNILKDGKADFFYRSEDGYTYLHLAAYYGNIVQMGYMLDYFNYKDAYIVKRNSKYHIVFASFRKKSNALKYLIYEPFFIRKMIHIEKIGRYYCIFSSAFTYTAAKNILKKLKSISLSLSSTTKMKNTPLHFLAINNKIKTFDIVRFLKYYGGNFTFKNINGVTPLDILKVTNKKIYNYIISKYGERK